VVQRKELFVGLTATGTLGEAAAVVERAFFTRIRSAAAERMFYYSLTPNHRVN
jgi:hypothetical protein